MVISSGIVQFSVINTHPPPCGLSSRNGSLLLFFTTVMRDFLGTT